MAAEMTDDPRLAELVKELYTAKQNEEVAKKARIAVEERIAALVPTAENGSRTVDSGVMKVTVKRENSYKITEGEDAFAIAYPNLVKTVPAKIEIDAKAYEAERAKDSPLFREASKYVVVKPKKVSVSLKV